MNRLTAVFLILLRLAIGWHFLYEGLHKLHTLDLGPTSTNRPFSSAGYFREAPGPFATFMRGQLGDPDAVAVAELTVEPVPAGEDVTKYPPQRRMPTLIKQEWEDYVARFSAHYGLDERQRTSAQATLEQAESQIVTWLTNPRVDDKTPTVKKTYPSGVVEEKLSIPERITEYKAALEDLHNTTGKRLRAFNSDVEGRRLAAAKADVAQRRNSLVSDLREKTAEYLEKPLREKVGLTAEQLEKGALPESEGDTNVWWVSATRRVGKWLGLHEPATVTKQWALDVITVLFLIVVGGGLMAGLFTRLWCLAGAAFLCVTYLAAPPFPWLPVPPVSEGNYAWVNKNLIEMLALLTLATTASGCWFGLDALIHAVFGRRRRPEPRRA
jgi:uncharacterized membrane protein YphA (DoxX/SURF4 family)